MAADLKNNFYLLPKAKEQSQMKKSTGAMAAKAKENRSKELEMRQQSLVRLQTTQNVLLDLATRSERLSQDQNQVMAIIQSILDKPKSEPDLICKAQYEQELHVSCILLIIFQSHSLIFLFLIFLSSRIQKRSWIDCLICWRSCAWLRSTKIV